MKKLFLYLFLGLLWCNVGVADDLKGKKLYCAGQSNHYSFEFTYFSRVKVIMIIPSSRTWKKFKQNTYNYETDNHFISVKLPNYNLNINRKSLTLSSYTNCELVDSSVDLKSKMRKIHDSIKKSETSENKI
tara:strand:+ start:64 stop:456 length:393 start_codon:yes stop_codon:yes gene_type:complete